MKKINSIKDWLPINEIKENGIIKLKDNSFIKIINIKPINFNLKSKLEKEAILQSYKIFLKTYNSNLQILIQSNKEDLSKHISKIKKINIDEEEKIIEISKRYIQFIKQANKEKNRHLKNILF